MTDIWMRVEMFKEKDIVVVDCGYASEQLSRDRADKIFTLGVGKKNFEWGATSGPDPRIHILIPPTKVKKVLAALPITDRKTWFGATHSFKGEKNG